MVSPFSTFLHHWFVVPSLWGSFASGLNRQVSGTLSLKASVLVITIPVSAAHCGRPPGARVFCGNVGHVNAGCAND